MQHVLEEGNTGGKGVMGAIFPWFSDEAKSHNWQMYYETIQGRYHNNVVSHCMICGNSNCMTAHEIPSKKKETTMFKSLKEYYAKHQELIITILGAFLIDHVMFDGKFGHKLEAIMEGLIDKLTAKVKSIEEK